MIYMIPGGATFADYDVVSAFLLGVGPSGWQKPGYDIMISQSQACPFDLGVRYDCSGFGSQI